MALPLTVLTNGASSQLFLSVPQRIAASELAPGLQYFGCSIHGELDLNEDGLVDLEVGGLGNAVILWLVPLLFLTVGLS